MSITRPGARPSFGIVMRAGGSKAVPAGWTVQAGGMKIVPLGGGIGMMAILTKNELLSAMVGGVFVVEALSVMVQVASFKLTGAATGADVAALIDRWGVDAIVTAGDNNYLDGAAETIDANIGQYYYEFIHPYTGAYGAGADTNRFFPSLGNHDWNTTNAQPYLNYFTLLREKLNWASR